MEVTLKVQVEELVEAHPDAVGFLADRNVVCIVCGEPYWGTLGDLMTQKGFDDSDQQVVVEDLKAHLGGASNEGASDQA